ncbi:MAG: hypothetical protein H0T89_14765 [Deltaproteobacteria bacterium]|nr:hypothetical protein [Deltaproteobacteria bacterium]MDQ3295481.1 hypothetical protein [Myxococcota bacterium]
MATGLSETLRETIAYAKLPTDHRGLLPLERARAILATTQVYPKAVVHEGRTPEEVEEVAIAHAIHAALVSLESADEALAHLTQLTWHGALFDGCTLVERYGITMLPWVGGRVVDGMLIAPVYGLEATFAAFGTEEAFDLLMKLKLVDYLREPGRVPVGDVAAVPELEPKAALDGRVFAVIDRFIAAQPVVAARVLARRMVAAPKVKRWRELAARLPKTAAVEACLDVVPAAPLTAKAILDVLDTAAKDPSPETWPKFATATEDDPDTLEYHALRLVAARSRGGEDWGIVLERITGSYSPWEPTRIQRFVYGSTARESGRTTEKPIAFELDRVPDHANGEPLETALANVVVNGPAGPAKLSDATAKKLDLRPGMACELEGDAGFNLRLRGYLALHPDAFWAPPADAIAELAIPDAEVLVVATEFRHVVGATYERLKKTVSWHGLPSKSETYKSLAAALVARKPKLFKPGEPNTDWRLHAVHEIE